MNAIKAEADKKVKEIESAQLSPEDTTKLKQQVEAEKNKGIENVNKATSPQDVTTKKDEAIKAIQGLVIATSGDAAIAPNVDFNGSVNGSSLINTKPIFDLSTVGKLSEPYFGTGLNDFGLKKDSTKDDVKFIPVNDTKPSTSIKRSEKPASEKPVSQLPNTAGGNNMAINALGALTLTSVLGLAATKRKKEDN